MGDRIVAIGHIDGNEKYAWAALLLAGVVNDQGYWTGKNTIIILADDIPSLMKGTLIKNITEPNKIHIVRSGSPFTIGYNTYYHSHDYMDTRSFHSVFSFGQLNIGHRSRNITDTLFFTIDKPKNDEILILEILGHNTFRLLLEHYNPDKIKIPLILQKEYPETKRIRTEKYSEIETSPSKKQKRFVPPKYMCGAKFLNMENIIERLLFEE